MCRMILAIGKVKLDSLIEGLMVMAKDENEEHEHNVGIKGKFRHEDGWGIAYWNGNSWKIEKSTCACYKDSAIEKLRGVETNVAVLHARYALKGDVSLENTHPFQFGNYLFCHNGQMDDDVKYLTKVFHLKGQTDSEKLFYSILSHLQEGKEAESIKEFFSRMTFFSALNCMLVTPKNVFIALKTDKSTPKYHTTKMLRKNGMLVVSSETLPQLKGNWESLKDDTLMNISTSSLDVSYTHL